jgi:hypothetical protein
MLILYIYIYIYFLSDVYRLYELVVCINHYLIFIIDIISLLQSSNTSFSVAIYHRVVIFFVLL